MRIESQPPKLLTIRQVTELMGVSRGTVYNWIKRGLVTYIKTPSDRYRIFASSLLKRKGA